MCGRRTGAIGGPNAPLVASRVSGSPMPIVLPIQRANVRIICVLLRQCGPTPSNRFTRFFSLPSGTARFRTMRLFCPVLRTRPLHALLLHVSFAQIWSVLAVQLRCRKIFLLCPSSAIPRRTDLLYLPKIRIGAYSLHRPHPGHGCRTSRRRRRILRQSCRWLTPRLLFAAARSSYANDNIPHLWAPKASIPEGRHVH